MDTITEARQYPIFKPADRVFALDADKVAEVLDYTNITRIPRTPEFMPLMNLRGSGVPVVDLRLAFGLSRTEKAANTCIVVVDVSLDGESLVLGALADSVGEVIDLEPDRIQPGPQLGAGINGEQLSSLSRTE